MALSDQFPDWEAGKLRSKKGCGVARGKRDRTHLPERRRIWQGSRCYSSRFCTRKIVTLKEKLNGRETFNFIARLAKDSPVAAIQNCMVTHTHTPHTIHHGILQLLSSESTRRRGSSSIKWGTKRHPLGSWKTSHPRWHKTRGWGIIESWRWLHRHVAWGSGHNILGREVTHWESRWEHLLRHRHTAVRAIC